MVNIVICFLAPWLAMFLHGKILQGILCILLHITIIGWIRFPTSPLFELHDKSRGRRAAIPHICHLPLVSQKKRAGTTLKETARTPKGCLPLLGAPLVVAAWA